MSETDRKPKFDGSWGLGVKLTNLVPRLRQCHVIDATITVSGYSDRGKFSIPVNYDSQTFLNCGSDYLYTREIIGLQHIGYPQQQCSSVHHKVSKSSIIIDHYLS